MELEASVTGWGSLICEVSSLCSCLGDFICGVERLCTWSGTSIVEF